MVFLINNTVALECGKYFRNENRRYESQNNVFLFQMICLVSIFEVFFAEYYKF